MWLRALAFVVIFVNTFPLKVLPVCFALPEKAFIPTLLCLSQFCPLACSFATIHVGSLPWQTRAFLLQGPGQSSSLCLRFFSPCFIHRTPAHASGLGCWVSFHREPALSPQIPLAVSPISDCIASCNFLHGNYPPVVILLSLWVLLIHWVSCSWL